MRFFRGFLRLEYRDFRQDAFVSDWGHDFDHWCNVEQKMGINLINSERSKIVIF